MALAGLKQKFPINTGLSPTEKALKYYRIRYEKAIDGTLIVVGDIDLSSKVLKELPDFSNVKVLGDFLCQYNRLTSLRGAPKYVEGLFKCSHNPDLKSLEHLPDRFGSMESDFGNFDRRREIPEELCVSDETRAALAEEERKSRAGYPLEQDMRAVKRFKIIPKNNQPSGPKAS